jgi:hypothetical protein
VPRIGDHRRFTANHTWHADYAGRRLFIKASSNSQEARAEREGYARISRFYPVPRLHGTRRIGPWTVLTYDRWPHLSLDTGLLLDEISYADLTGDIARLDACLTAVFSQYRQAISRTLRRATLAETIGKLYADRAAPGGRLDRYYQADAPWLLTQDSSLRPSALATLTLIVNGREHALDFAELADWLRYRLGRRSLVWAAITQGDPTDFNVGWSPVDGPVWFDYDTGGLNALPGEFACFLLYQRLHGAWLTPRYNPAAFRDHPSALATAALTEPAIGVQHSRNLLRIDYQHAPSPGRRHVLRSYLTGIIQPVAAQLGINDLMDWLRPYLVMRILAVYHLAELEPHDTALSLGMLAEALDPATTLPAFLGMGSCPKEDRNHHAHGGPR